MRLKRAFSRSLLLQKMLPHTAAVSQFSCFVDPGFGLRVLLVVPCLMWGLVAHADWTEVSGAPGLRKYVDLGSVQRSGAVVRIRELIDFNTAQPFSGERVTSIRWINEYHCEHRQTRVVSYEAFDEPMGQGIAKVAGAEVVDWAAVPEGSLSSKVWSVLCHA